MADGSDERPKPSVGERTRNEREADAIPEAVREVVALYEARPELCFPDVDHHVLEAHCEEVRSGIGEVQRAQAALDEARRVQDERHAALWACARRAFSYAHVYAEDKAELSAELAEFQLARGAGSAAGKKARRTPKTKSPKKKAAAQEHASELPFESQGSRLEEPPR